jgi:hypothetical protein
MSTEKPAWLVDPEDEDGWVPLKPVSELIGLEPDSEVGWGSGRPFEDMLDDFDGGGAKTVWSPSTTAESTFTLPRPTPEFESMAELNSWWLNSGCQDASLVISKYQEYGNTALLEVGRQLAEVMGRGATKAEMQELGIWFFMVGKMARWKTAILKGERVSKDTLDDLAVYATMARRVHEKGGWPDGE